MTVVCRDAALAGRASNIARAAWRARCRQLMSEHLSKYTRRYTRENRAQPDQGDLVDRIGVHVSPDRVRLRPSYEDGYRWVTLPGREHLFAKPLSKHSTGAYMEMCRELGRSIEAARYDTSDHDDDHNTCNTDAGAVETLNVEGSFRTALTRLQTEVSTLQLEVCRHEESSRVAELARQSCSELLAQSTLSLNAV